MRTILLVDDETHVTYVVASKLKLEGFNPIIADHGEQGFDLAQKTQPDLIVSDYQMPRMNGFEMCVKLKETSATRNIPVVMLTARGHRLSPEEIERTNIQALMAKPFSVRELVGRIKELLGESSAAGAAAA